jgi:hypothetical protein
LGQRAPERRSVGAGRWPVVEWSVGTGPSFGEKELGAGRWTVRVRGGRSLGGRWAEGTVAGEGEIWEIWEIWEWREKWKIWSEPDSSTFLL